MELTKKTTILFSEAAALHAVDNLSKLSLPVGPVNEMKEELNT